MQRRGSVQYFNAMDEIILDTLEIGGVPVVALAATEDFRNSSERLREIYEAYFPMSFENFDAPRDVSANAKMECGVCWHVYDPALGDDVWQIPPGRIPSAHCPRIGAVRIATQAQAKFMRLADERDG